MQQTTITCDAPGCTADLTESDGAARYRLTVTADILPTRGNRPCTRWAEPPLDRDYHFCNWACLHRWAVSHD